MADVIISITIPSEHVAAVKKAVEHRQGRVMTATQIKKVIRYHFIALVREWVSTSEKPAYNAAFRPTNPFPDEPNVLED